MADNLVLGRGKLFFAPYPKNHTSEGVKGYFGNTTALALAMATTQLDHFSSEGGLKVKDRSIQLQSDMTVTFSADNINLGNMALWFGGSSVGTEPSDAPTDMGDLSFIGSANAVYGALYFESDNPVGDNKNFWWPYVNLRPNGNLDLKGDTWQSMSFTAEALKRDSSTERMYVYAAADGSSFAPTDTTPQFTPDTAGVFSDLFASTATLTATTPQVHAVPFDVVFTLNAGTGGEDLMAYAFINSGSILTGTRTLLVGATGTVSMTIPSAGTVTIKAFDNNAGTGTALGTSSNVVAS